MRKLTTCVLASLLMVLGAVAASAQIDVDLAFDPEVVNAGETVTVFAGIANMGDEDVVVDLGMMLTVNDMQIGPFLGQLPLAAGQELSHEFAFMVPPIPFDVMLTIDVTATAGEFSDTASASLTIIGAEDGAGKMRDFERFGKDWVESVTTSGAAPNLKATLGQVKRQYR